MKATPAPRSGDWSAWTGWVAEDEVPAAVPRDILSIARRVKLTLHKMRVDHGLPDNAAIPMANMRELANIHVPRVEWPRPRQVAIYTPEEIRHLIRLDRLGAQGGERGATPAPDHWRRPDPDPYWMHGYGYSQNGWKNVRVRPGLEAASAGGVGDVGGVGGVGASGPGAGWEGAARGWAAGAVLLAVLVLLVRAFERFLHTRFFKGRRRSSEEWPTPNVLATSHRYGDDSPPPRLDDSDSFPSDGRESSGNDLPPPYSECANNESNMPLEVIDPNKPLGMEEPPPPYSACYFSNPKDGIPTVHFYNRRNAESSENGQSSADCSNEPNISNARCQGNDTSDDKDMACESASIESGVSRNIEAVSGSDNIGSDATSTETLQPLVAREGDQIPGHLVHFLEPASHQERVVSV